MYRSLPRNLGSITISPHPSVLAFWKSTTESRLSSYTGLLGAIQRDVRRQALSDMDEELAVIEWLVITSFREASTSSWVAFLFIFDLH
jgi:hypothetical protein